MDNKEEEEEAHPHQQTSEGPILDASYLDDDYGGMILMTDDYVSRPFSLLSLGHNNNNSSDTTTSYKNNLQGEETIASMTGSILDQLVDFDESSFSSVGGSFCSGGELFPSHHQSTTNRQLINFSTDSLDKSTNVLLLNPPNKSNYTIAFSTMSEVFSPQTAAVVEVVEVAVAAVAAAVTTTPTPPTKRDSNNNNNNRTLAEITTVKLPPDLDFLRLKTDKESHNTTTRKQNKISDWESLRVLLPRGYKHYYGSVKKKDVEKEDRSEKEVDEQESEEAVVVMMRNKRKSLGSCDGKSSRSKFQRFSLREIEEVVEICGGIEGILKEFGEFSRTSLSGRPATTTEKPNPKQKQERKKPKEESRRKTTTPTIPPNTQCNKKSDLTTAVTTSIAQLTRMSRGSRKKILSTSPQGKVIIESLCPALYAMLSDGLLASVETLFGRVPTTPWRVVEASVNSTPSSQLLQELVLRINSESETMSECGPLKFNAFVCGLLNVSSLSSWLLLLQQKDRLLRTHYDQGGLLYGVNSLSKGIFDGVVGVVEEGLACLDFSLDIFHETKKFIKRQLRCSNSANVSKMKRSFSDERPKARFRPATTTTAAATSRLPKSKTSQNINERLAEEEKRERESGKFRKLQLQWEMMSSGSSAENQLKSPGSCISSGSSVSRIPRPVVISKEIANKRRLARPVSAAFYGYYK